MQTIRRALNLFLDDLKYQLACLVDKMHHLKLAHGNLKPGNVGYKWLEDGIQLYMLDLGNT
ncbi:MAG: hypothetical protein EXS67_00095 [Candidatus Margulisbacteria bacterium]|nr:hypothetical protein [Candidatus Margulisiibacteriota bacterium]